MAKKKVTRQSKAQPKSAAKSRPRASTTKTKGLQHMAAGFTANDAAASIKWYCDVLGFSVAERWEKDGTFLGGSVVNGRVAINIGQDDWKLGRDRKKGQGVRLFITTADEIDTVRQSHHVTRRHARARAEGRVGFPRVQRQRSRRLQDYLPAAAEVGRHE